MLLEFAEWEYVILYGIGIIWNKISYKKHRFNGCGSLMCLWSLVYFGVFGCRWSPRQIISMVNIFSYYSMFEFQYVFA
jgi:hypothetical protein